MRIRGIMGINGLGIEEGGFQLEKQRRGIFTSDHIESRMSDTWDIVQEI
jgi:hypothetical protein